MTLPIQYDEKLWLAILHELDIAPDGQLRPIEVVERVTAYFPEIPREDLAIRTSSTRSKWHNTVAWARQHLVIIGFLAKEPRGHWRITDAGRAWVGQHWHGPEAEYSHLGLFTASQQRSPQPSQSKDNSVQVSSSEEMWLKEPRSAERRELNTEYTLALCARDTGLDETTLAGWARAVERKGQAVVYGPPGTGKTYVAEHLARHLIGGGDGFADIVQFHPAYAYEDFVQGIRPQPRPDGGIHYPVVPGRFLEFCEKARSRGGRSVLIIDEINRANLARVFGELMYLLEYRDREIPLAAGGVFHIPANVRIIGTMNTADRSIALVDHALRRRFAFLALHPNYESLRRFHEQTGFPVDGLIDILGRLNRQIGDRHYEVGISFFLRKNLADEISDIWRMEIEPYLEEYFFDQPDKVDAFRWDQIKHRVCP